MRLRGLLRLLDEAVQQKHLALVNAEYHARYPSMRNVASHFPKATAQGPNQRQAHRPGKLNVLDVFANELPIIRWQFPKPFAHRFPTARGAVKPCGQALENRVPRKQYQFWYWRSILLWGKQGGNQRKTRDRRDVSGP